MAAAPAPRLLAILIYATMLWSPCDSYYKWNTHRRIGNKICILARELVKDVEMKIMAVQGFRDQYYKSLQYQLGDIVYEMRHLFKKMVHLYQQTHQEVAYAKSSYHKSIPTLVEIQRMAMEIETQVGMVQGWMYKREKKDELQARMLNPLRSGAQRGDESEPLREAAARARMLRSARPRPRPRTRASHARAPAPPRRENKKWQYVTNNDFLKLL
ncbi:hypothetical protein PYW08_013671 [Mythimna loreyi]|uniref:Uncharacterized protein n=1 Tax=Mythimna loreyi TaxID=667449 RepID=A0ACC2R7F2_9NEOP|nr:hypothetical protein PYW08_013671 [Mythimna loreyi]